MKKALQGRYFASQEKQPDRGPVLEASHTPFHPKLHKKLQICVQRLKSSTSSSKSPLWKVKTSAQQDKLFADSEMAKKKLKLKKKKVTICAPVMDPSISSQQVSLREVQNQMLPLAETAPGADSAHTEPEKNGFGNKD